MERNGRERSFLWPRKEPKEAALWPLLLRLFRQLVLRLPPFPNKASFAGRAVREAHR